MTRKWTADIVVYDRKARQTISINSTDSESDLLADQTAVAIREAYMLGVVGSDDYDVEVILWKTTQAHGLERDRSYRPFLDRKGTLRYDGPFA